MPYRLARKDKSARAAVRRIACEEIDGALQALDAETLSFTDRVHEIRKACKKTRALLRLVRPACKVARRENAALRDIARQLSGIRDAGALVEAFDALPGDKAAGFAPIRTALVTKAAEVEASATTRAALDAVRADLEAAHSRARKWKLRADGAKAFLPGFGTAYALGRAALAKATTTPQAEAVHDLRKQVKLHWYHCRLLAPSAEPVLEPRVPALSDLCDELGAHQDLCVFETWLERHRDELRAATDVDGFAAILALCREDRRRAALNQTARLYAVRRKRLVRQVRSVWTRPAKATATTSVSAAA